MVLQEPLEAPSSPASPASPPPRLAAATRPPPIPSPARRTNPTMVALLTVTSQPAGATVVLVTAGRAHVAGLTPIRVAVDPRLDHDIIIAADGHATTIWRLPPYARRDITVHLPIRGE
ncbi:MAG: hypothetical protein M3680_20325 [Myxococcota bacterium]|nr:hypothetical protein [Myxococcota bacterium]